MLLAVVRAQAPPYYPPDPANVPLDFACAWRSFAAEYGISLRPDAAGLLRDAVQLTTLCNATVMLEEAMPTKLAMKQFVSSASTTIYVDGVAGSDSNPGTLTSPLLTIAAGVAKSRGLTRPTTLYLRGATYHLTSTIQLTSVDSGLTISSYQGESAWLSGAAIVPTPVWTPYSVTNGSKVEILPNEDNANGCSHDAATSICVCTPLASTDACVAKFESTSGSTAFTYHDPSLGQPWGSQCCVRLDSVWNPTALPMHTSGRLISKASNIWMTKINATSVVDLRVNGMRAVRARFPNANPETDLFPLGWVTTKSTWLPPKPSPPIIAINVFNAALSLRNSTENANYTGALGGSCHVYDPPFSYWCSEHPAGGGGFQYYVPGGVITAAGTLPSFSVNAGSVNIPQLNVWRAAHWANWAFEIESFNNVTDTIMFGKGGYQGARGGPGSDYFLENAIELLDVAGEWFFDASTSLLYYYNNKTGAPTSDMIFETPSLFTLISINATQSMPVKDVAIIGLGFRDTAPTFMETHAVPSGGDWALERIASVHAEGTENLVISHCNWTRIGGNALMLSGYHRDASITSNSFRLLGGSAMVAWGRTDEVSDNGIHGFDGTDGNFPANTTVQGNLASEIGVIAKQSSCWFQAKTAQTTLTGNVCFNVARAGFNFNDGFAGGDTVMNNLIFNTNREYVPYNIMEETTRHRACLVSSYTNKTHLPLFPRTFFPNPKKVRRPRPNQFVSGVLTEATNEAKTA